MTAPNFPVLDYERPGDEYERIVQRADLVTFRVDETDEWVNLPVRIVYVDDGLSGFVLEIGPYSVCGEDARLVANALAKFGQLSGDFRPVGDER
jgi:hypothetical protein